MRIMIAFLATIIACGTPSRDYRPQLTACPAQSDSQCELACDADGVCAIDYCAGGADYCSVPTCDGVATTGAVYTAHGMADVGDLPSCGEVPGCDRAFCAPLYPTEGWARGWSCWCHDDAFDEDQGCVLDACVP